MFDPEDDGHTTRIKLFVSALVRLSVEQPEMVPGLALVIVQVVSERAATIPQPVPFTAPSTTPPAALILSLQFPLPVIEIVPLAARLVDVTGAGVTAPSALPSERASPVAPGAARLLTLCEFIEKSAVGAAVWLIVLRLSPNESPEAEPAASPVSLFAPIA